MNMYMVFEKFTSEGWIGITPDPIIDIDLLESINNEDRLFEILGSKDSMINLPILSRIPLQDSMSIEQCKFKPLFADITNYRAHDNIRKFDVSAMFAESYDSMIHERPSMINIKEAMGFDLNVYAEGTSTWYCILPSGYFSILNYCIAKKCDRVLFYFD